MGKRKHGKRGGGRSGSGAQAQQAKAAAQGVSVAPAGNGQALAEDVAKDAVKEEVAAPATSVEAPATSAEESAIACEGTKESKATVEATVPTAGTGEGHQPSAPEAAAAEAAGDDVQEGGPTSRPDETCKAATQCEDGGEGKVEAVQGDAPVVDAKGSEQQSKPDKVLDLEATSAKVDAAADKAADVDKEPALAAVPGEGDASAGVTGVTLAAQPEMEEQGAALDKEDKDGSHVAVSAVCPPMRDAKEVVPVAAAEVAGMALVATELIAHPIVPVDSEDVPAAVEPKDALSTANANGVPPSCDESVASLIAQEASPEQPATKADAETPAGMAGKPCVDTPTEPANSPVAPSRIPKPPVDGVGIGVDEAQPSAIDGLKGVVQSSAADAADVAKEKLAPAAADVADLAEEKLASTTAEVEKVAVAALGVSEAPKVAARELPAVDGLNEVVQSSAADAAGMAEEKLAPAAADVADLAEEKLASATAEVEKVAVAALDVLEGPKVAARELPTMVADAVEPGSQAAEPRLDRVSLSDIVREHAMSQELSPAMKEQLLAFDEKMKMEAIGGTAEQIAAVDTSETPAPKAVDAATAPADAVEETKDTSNEQAVDETPIAQVEVSAGQVTPEIPVPKAGVTMEETKDAANEVAVGETTPITEVGISVDQVTPEVPVPKAADAATVPAVAVEETKDTAYRAPVDEAPIAQMAASVEQVAPETPMDAAELLKLQDRSKSDGGDVKVTASELPSRIVEAVTAPVKGVEEAVSYGIVSAADGVSQQSAALKEAVADAMDGVAKPDVPKADGTTAVVAAVGAAEGVRERELPSDVTANVVGSVADEHTKVSQEKLQPEVGLHGPREKGPTEEHETQPLTGANEAKSTKTVAEQRLPAKGSSLKKLRTGVVSKSKSMFSCFGGLFSREKKSQQS